MVATRKKSWRLDGQESDRQRDWLGVSNIRVYLTCSEAGCGRFRWVGASSCDRTFAAATGMTRAATCGPALECARPKAALPREKSEAVEGGMGLVGRLSNPDLTTLFQVLTSHDWRQPQARQRGESGVAPDGRRKFGTVRDAIVQVLARADSDVRVRDIHKGVEDVLGGPVSPSSVKDYLRKGCRRRAPLFEYRGRDGYRLAR
jgi:hypothetical protein